MNESDINQNRHINTSSTIVHFAPDEITTTSQQIRRYAPFESKLTIQFGGRCGDWGEVEYSPDHESE